MSKTDSARSPVDLDELVVDCRQRFFDRRIVRSLAFPIIVITANGRIGNVESPAGHAGDLRALFQQIDHFRCGADPALTCLAIQPGQLAVLDVRTVLRFDATHFPKHRLEQCFRPRRIIRLQLRMDPGAHDGLCDLVPGWPGRAGPENQQGQTGKCRSHLPHSARSAARLLMDTPRRPWRTSFRSWAEVR